MILSEDSFGSSRLFLNIQAWLSAPKVALPPIQRCGLDGGKGAVDGKGDGGRMIIDATERCCVDLPLPHVQ